MENRPRKPQDSRSRPPALGSLLGPYRGQIAVLAALTILANSLNLLVPWIVARAIDQYSAGTFQLPATLEIFFAAAFGVFVFAYLQSIVQTLASEKVARDLRQELTAKISGQDHIFIQSASPAKLLTNLTSDVDAVKTFVSQALPSILASVFLIAGASILLLSIDWQLGLAVLAIIPVIGGTFAFVLSKVRKLFKKSQEAVDWLNKVISESIWGSALIRLVHFEDNEFRKFVAANTQAREISLSILRLFASLIPIIIFSTNIATLTILVLGGRFVIGGSMSLGDFTAFNSYLSILIFPVIVIGFMSNVMAQASASYGRISGILLAPEPKESGRLATTLKGDIALHDVCLSFGEKQALRSVTFEVAAGTRNAVIGPTAAGKTQLLHVLTGLAKPDSGSVKYDGVPSGEYTREALYRQVGFVFQDSTLFNLSLRENIAFSKSVSDAELEKAIQTAELKEFIGSLPNRLDTIVSERGTSLSGGQKQRIMLARALALNPRILLLDDFTARVDVSTERRILENVRTNYPGITLLSVTQKIAPVEDYDQIVLMMEGEVLARGTHQELLGSCPEYVQIYESQRSTSHYEQVRAS